MMKQNNVEKTSRFIRRKTRKKYSAEDKIRIVFEALRVEEYGRLILPISKSLVGAGIIYR